MKVYHVIESTKAANFFKGDFLGRREVSRHFSDLKKYNVEKIFEEVRSTQYPLYPSRLDALFVFPNIEMAYTYMSKLESDHIILVLDIISPIYWFDMDIFTIAGPMSDQTIQKEAERYWAGGKVMYEDVKVKHEPAIIEGLTYGEAKIIDIYDANQSLV